MMNKKEAAAFEKAKSELAAAMALCWPTEPKPEPVEVLKELNGVYGALLVGWNQFNYDDNFSVRQGCSNGHSHSSSRTDKTDSQRAGVFYRRESEALLAARWEMCNRFAKALAKLDALYFAAKEKERN